MRPNQAGDLDWWRQRLNRWVKDERGIVALMAAISYATEVCFGRRSELASEFGEDPGGSCADLIQNGVASIQSTGLLKELDAARPILIHAEAGQPIGGSTPETPWASPLVGLALVADAAARCKDPNDEFGLEHLAVACYRVADDLVSPEWIREIARARTSVWRALQDLDSQHLREIRAQIEGADPGPPTASKKMVRVLEVIRQGYGTVGGAVCKLQGEPGFSRTTMYRYFKEAKAAGFIDEGRLTELGIAVVSQAVPGTDGTDSTGKSG